MNEHWWAYSQLHYKSKQGHIYLELTFISNWFCNSKPPKLLKLNSEDFLEAYFFILLYSCGAFSQLVLSRCNFPVALEWLSWYLWLKILAQTIFYTELKAHEERWQNYVFSGDHAPAEQLLTRHFLQVLFW